MDKDGWIKVFRETEVGTRVIQKGRKGRRSGGTYSLQLAADCYMVAGTLQSLII